MCDPMEIQGGGSQIASISKKRFKSEIETHPFCNSEHVRVALRVVGLLAPVACH